MSRTTKTSTTTLALLWLLVGADVIHAFGQPMPLGLLCWTLSVLIVASLLDGIVLILSGPACYRALRLGEQIERRRHRCATATTTVTPGQRKRMTTG